MDCLQIAWLPSTACYDQIIMPLCVCSCVMCKSHLSAKSRAKLVTLISPKTSLHMEQPRAGTVRPVSTAITAYRKIAYLATLNDQLELRNAAIVVKGNEIVYVGPDSDIPHELLSTVDYVKDLSNHLVLPGLCLLWLHSLAGTYTAVGYDLDTAASMVPRHNRRLLMQAWSPHTLTCSSP